MLKKKMNDLMNSMNSDDQQKFMVIQDSEAGTVVGGYACAYLGNCGTYSGNDNTCPNLTKCGTYSET